MQDMDSRMQSHRKVTESIAARKERRINLLCFGLAAVLGIFLALAFLLSWFSEAPPLMP